jgi:hypothetical protein
MSVGSGQPGAPTTSQQKCHRSAYKVKSDIEIKEDDFYLWNSGTFRLCSSTQNLQI